MRCCEYGLLAERVELGIRGGVLPGGETLTTQLLGRGNGGYGNRGQGQPAK